jgi:hypothetical protein
MCRELGPVLCCLLLAGRVGAAMAAELSSMKITEQPVCDLPLRRLVKEHARRRNL